MLTHDLLLKGRDPGGGHSCWVREGHFRFEISDISDGKAAEIGNMFMVGLQVLVKEFIGHGSIGGGGDEEDVFRQVGTFGFKDFNHEFSGLLQVLSVNLDFNGRGVAFIVAFATWDPVRGEANFKVGVMFLDHGLDDLVHGITAVEGGRHVA